VEEWDAIVRRQVKVADSAKAARDCLDQATGIEGRVEALLAKVSAERELSDGDLGAPGAVRQGLHSLRAAIKDEEPLPWWGSEVEQYAALKNLAVYTSCLLATSTTSGLVPACSTAIENFRRITSNAHEKAWTKTARALLRVETDSDSTPAIS
jgi:hypothetical protein